MTGFGRGSSTTHGWRVEVELSGVNRKQVDIGVSLPTALADLESEIRRFIGESVSRGRVSVKVTLSSESGAESCLSFDRDMARQYVEAARTISDDTGIEARLTAADLFRAPGIFKVGEVNVDTEQAKAPLFEALEAAMAQFIQMQEEEGAHLKSDLTSRIAAIESDVSTIATLAPRVPENQRQVLHNRLSDSGLSIDLNDDRILKEIALFAERCDITEELTRLNSHISQFRNYLESSEPKGRPLDFLCQELNRELNTIGSKANDSEIAQQIVNSKTELEKIREQVQNVQ